MRQEARRRQTEALSTMTFTYEAGPCEIVVSGQTVVDGRSQGDNTEKWIAIRERRAE
jgi:hypothetical protein